MAIRSFTRSVLLKTGRNLPNFPAGDSVDNSDPEGSVNIVFVMGDGTHCPAKGKEGECLCDLANRNGLEVDDPVRCMMAYTPPHYYADNIFYNNLPGPGKSKLDEQLSELISKQCVFNARVPICKEFEGLFVQCSSGSHHPTFVA